MLAFTSIKRSPPMMEEEARTIQKETHLFGYEPMIIQVGTDWHLQIRGDGQDDDVLANRLFQLRKPKWKSHE
jgi:hypothetical protein